MNNIKYIHPETLIVRRQSPPKISLGGIHIPEGEETNVAKVMRIGSRVSSVTIDDYILLMPDQGYELQIQGQPFIQIRESSIKAIL